MTAFRLSPAVAEAYPATHIDIVTATGLRGREPWPVTAVAMADLEQEEG